MVSVSEANAIANRLGEQYEPRPFQDAGSIACQFEHAFGVPRIQQPLEQFLREAAAIHGLDALVLVGWVEPGVFMDLSIHAFANLTPRYTGKQPVDCAPDEVTCLHRTLERALRAGEPMIASGLSFFDTKGESLEAALLRFDRDVHDDSQELLDQRSYALFTVISD